jgi:hypothetical protein
MGVIFITNELRDIRIYFYRLYLSVWSWNLLLLRNIYFISSPEHLIIITVIDISYLLRLIFLTI